MKEHNVAENGVSASNAGAEKRISDLVRLFSSRKAAAGIANVSIAQLHRYMTGDSQPPFGAIARMALDRDVRLEWVWTGEGPMRDDMIAEERAAYGDTIAIIDWELMERAIAAVDLVVQRRHLAVTAKWKGEMTSLIYRYYKEQGGQEEGLSAADRQTLMDIIDAALRAGETNGESDH